MRTTLDIDEDVLRAAEDLARREQKTAGKVVSEVFRRALAMENESCIRVRVRNGIPLLSVLPDAPSLTNERVDKLRDEDIG
jgi:hypothetical protein